jgi:hypothetical protein
MFEKYVLSEETPPHPDLAGFTALARLGEHTPVYGAVTNCPLPR